MSKIPVIDFEKAESLLENPPYFHIYKIKAKLDLEIYRNLYRETIEAYKFFEKDGLDTYDAISLQYNKRSGKDPYSDGVEFGGLDKNHETDEIKFKPDVFSSRLDGAIDRSDFNDIGKMWNPWFEFLEEKFPKIHMFRTRLLRTKSGHSAPTHVDEEACRIHLPLYTNRYNIMWFEDVPYYMPADGSIYICNTGAVGHQFANVSGMSNWLGKPMDRIHLVTVAKPKSRMFTNWSGALPG